MNSYGYVRVINSIIYLCNPVKYVDILWAYVINKL